MGVSYEKDGYGVESLQQPETPVGYLMRELDESRRRARELLRLITANNNKASDECKRWQCSERDDGRQCPNCPMDYFIKL